MMNSSGEFKFFDLLKSFLLSGAFDLLGACVPREFLLEREDAPRCSWLDMLGLQAQHYQICHERDGHRSFHSRGILSDLCMPQAQSTFQFLKTDLHRPSSINATTMRAVAIGRLVTSSLVCLGLSLRRRRLRITVTSPRWRSWACLTKVQKVRCRPVGTSGGTRTRW